MAGTGNPPAVFVQVIIGCVTAKAGLWHRGLLSPVFFCIFPDIAGIFSDIFRFYPLKPGASWFIIAGSMSKDANQNERI